MKKYYLVALLLSLVLAGCTALPKNQIYPKSSAYKEYTSTRIGSIFEQESRKHPKKSGFYILPYGADALRVRIALCDIAQKSLDLQYYLWHDDNSGALLAQHILQAANRGVKVRVLIDDIGLAGRDNIIASIDAHPNIDIRIFNPFSSRNLHLFDFVSDFDRLNHRMHNKTFVADNSIAIIGGRNIGDHYFALSKESNFRDLDIISVGPVVRNISSVYDHFWNGNWSVPINALSKSRYTYRDIANIKIAIDKEVAKSKVDYTLDTNYKQRRARLLSLQEKLIWAKGYYIWDDPEVMHKHYTHQKGTMIEKLAQRVKTVKKSITIESAYFVPRDSGIRELQKLNKRGIKVRLLTNSLVSNDVVPAHAGYASYRKDLVESGVELYELRGDVGGKGITNQSLLTSTGSSGLHTKSMVFDGRDTFIGSFNLDPRSASINTEGGLYVISPQLSKQVLEYMDEGVKPEHSYRVLQDKKGHLLWRTYINSEKVLYSTEPEAGVVKRIESCFIGLLPIELQL